MRNEKKFTLVDRLDVFKNKIRRNTKHLFIPMIFGTIGAIFMSYFIITYFPSDSLNTIYITGLWDTSFAQFHGQEFVHTNNQEFPVNEALDYFLRKTLDSITWFLVIFASAFIVLSAMVFHVTMLLADIHSEKDLEDQHIKGTKIISESQLTYMQNKKGITGAIVGNTAILDTETECQHTFISGSAGTGKTVILNQQYKWQKNNRPNGRWIIHDTKGDYLEHWYNPSTDYIFNFSDSRSINFNIFSIIKLIPDIKAVIASAIPKESSKEEPVWVNNAREILEGIFLYSIKHNKKTNLDVKKLIQLSPSELAKKLKSVQGAEIAYGHLTAGESQTATFMSNFRTKAVFFTSLPEHMDGEELDIAQWLENKEKTQSTIFLLNDTKNKDLNAVRIAVFVDSIIKTFLSMEESKERRVYFFLDELGSLGMIPSIVDGLALLRSFRGAFYIGIQEINRLYAIYGKDLTSTIVNNTATKIILRAQEVETQKFCSNQIGEVKIKTTSLTNSTGSEIHANREGASFNSTEKIENAILASEIGNMEDNTYYYKNASYPWTFIRKVFTQEDTYEKTQKAFIPRDDLAISNLFLDDSVEDDGGNNSTSSTGGQSLKEETNKGISDTSTESSKDGKKNTDPIKKDISSVSIETEEISFGL